MEQQNFKGRGTEASNRSLFWFMQAQQTISMKYAIKNQGADSLERTWAERLNCTTGEERAQVDVVALLLADTGPSFHLLIKSLSEQLKDAFSSLAPRAQ